ncbi:peptidoglycan-binding domain-containing protein [Streptomyces aidingensis]|uniref:Putative peptidoglycan binding domain-containing protein n=1 Tax=Streptomyces aidingensis TaxID=910347 RepID=A0A1I1LCH6_9ACTN|nr:peptidoglycan-binding domain-containing protein [Streptomyces aidingensis]SFC68083.1 Putative peptidoglycan binding domain-containing protein [Streptomyces aidingensis]
MNRKLASVLGTLVLGAAAVLVTPGTAQAAYPTCNAQKVKYVSGSLFTYQPYYTGTGSRNCVMGYGAQSNGVYALQNAIDFCYRNISVDGIYGPQTRQAVWDVQAEENVGRDGVYGPVTRKAMEWPLYEGGRGGGFKGCTEPGF